MDTHKSFIHASNGGREFKKLLHELTDQAPIAGIALKAMISPVGAALTAATIAFGFFKKAIDDFGARTDALEKGTNKPIINIKDALREAQKAVADFDRDWQKFQNGQNKSGAEKLVENLNEQLSLLDKQVGAAEKLSKVDKERLEHQKLLVTQGLQSRALFALNAQKTAAGNEVSAANAAERSISGRPSIARAEGLIKADEEFVSKQRAELEHMPHHDIVPGMPPGEVEGLMAKNAARSSLEQQIQAAERRIEQNKNFVLRTEEEKKNAAARTASARGRLSGATSAFDNMSMALDQTNQSIRTSGGFGNTSPISTTEQWLADKAARLNEWNISHGIGDIKSPVSKNIQDKTSNDIADLNKMLGDIINPTDGMKVNFQVKDE